MREEDAVRDGRLHRVLHEFLAPAVNGPSVPLEVSAYHVHGEPVSVAEALAADYEPFEVGSRWGPAWDTTWFRVRGKIPPDWAGRTVDLRFEIGKAGETGFGAEALVWRDGRPVQGLSPNHRRFPVFLAARGGEEVELLVEAAANPRSPFGANPWPLLMPEPHGEPLFTLGRADLSARDRALEAFRNDFRVLLELLDDLSVNDPRKSRVRAGLERACRALDLSRLGETYRVAAPYLTELLGERASPGAHLVSIAGHAHLDTAWLWPLRETVRKCARTFSTALALMEEYPEYRFVVSQAQHLAWMRDHFPDLWSRMKERIAEGRLEPTGSMWVEADCNIPSGESLVRQVVLGKRFYLSELGIETEDVWLPDVFGYSGALPQIMRRAGVRWFLTQKLSWNQYNHMPHHSFLWEGIDGSRVFTHFPPSDTYGGHMSVRELRFGVRNFRDHERTGRSLYLFGWGDGGGGPTAEMLESARRLSDLDGVPRLTMQGARQFFAEAEAEIDDPPVWSGELYLELHRGTYTTQAAAKRGNRRCESALRDAELWSALLPGEDYPAERIEEQWRTLLTHQFHDIIPGSGIHWVYEDTGAAHAAVEAVAEEIVADALGARAGSLDTSGLSNPVVVFNSLSHGRSDLVRLDAPAEAGVAVDAAGTRLPLQRDAGGGALLAATVPACGWATYDLDSGDAEPPEAVSAGEWWLENAELRVELDGRGLVTSVYDKAAGREVLVTGRPGNLMQLHPDYPNFYDAWDVDRHYLEQVTDLVDVDSLEVCERGPLRVALRVTRTFGSSRVVQVISLAGGSRAVGFDTEVDWQEENRFLKVAFPVAVRSSRATFEIQYGHVERPTHANTSWDLARFEVCAHRWADLSEPGYGVALLNDCKYGYDVRGDVLRLSLLRAPTWPDPAADRGSHRFAYQLLPHRGDLREAGVVRAGYELNVPLRAVAARGRVGGGARVGSLLAVDADNVVIEVAKRGFDEAGVLVVRLYEAWGSRGPATVTAPWSVARATRTDLLEREIEEVPANGRAVALDLGPFEIVTLKLEPGRSAGARRP